VPPSHAIVELYPGLRVAKTPRNVDIIAIHNVGEEARTAWISLDSNPVAPVNTRVSKHKETWTWLDNTPLFDEMEPADSQSKTPAATDVRLPPQSLESGLDWLKDPQMLPKAFPEARIMRSNLDIMASDLSSSHSLQLISIKFIEALRAKRQDEARPIIFICSGFGGIIVEQIMISLDKGGGDDILPNVTGIMFLATPFRDATGLIEDAVLWSGGTDRVKEVIRKRLQANFGPDKLSKLRDHFMLAASKHQFELSFFYQQDGFQGYFRNSVSGYIQPLELILIPTFRVRSTQIAKMDLFLHILQALAPGTSARWANILAPMIPSIEP
jgi:hypothetical protein